MVTSDIATSLSVQSFPVTPVFPSVKPHILLPNDIYQGDARELLKVVEPNSIVLSFWSPPYFVGKSYEKDLTFNDWQDLLREVIALHFPVIRGGGFLAINIADILAFADESMPRIQADNISTKKCPITREEIEAVKKMHPDFNRYQLARILGCSEQTIQRRTEHNNVRGGKNKSQTRVKQVGGLIENWAEKAGFYLYDRRIWIKDPCWQNSKWHSLSYRAIDEFEYVYLFWKPGITTVDRRRLSREEWSEWGSRAVWYFPSVRRHDVHEAEFPIELPRRVIRLLSALGEQVLDCFIGSGTTAVAAIQEGRQYLGFDNDKQSVAVARQRCLQAHLGVTR